MDIVLEDKNYAIIIENKTGTRDTKGQLLKYKKFAKQKKLKDYIILYLTPKGEVPTDFDALNDEKIVSISYLFHIRDSMINAKEDILNNKILSSVIQQYIDSIPLYAYKLPINWKYELDTLVTITKNMHTFNQCADITNIVNNNIIQEEEIFSTHEINIAKWITKYFIKSKAMIERDFMLKLSDILDDDLEDIGFVFSNNSNILVNDFPDNNNIDLNFDVNTIYKARRNRTKEYSQKLIDENIGDILEETKSMFCYEKRINDEDTILLIVQNDIFGLTVYFYEYKNNELINNNLNKLVNLSDSDVFSSKNISKLLDENTSNIILQSYKEEIINGLKEINI